jgi:signal transduction histidine kinase
LKATLSSTERQMVIVALLLAAVVGLFIAAESGQRRLEHVSQRVEQAAQRERVLADFSQLLSEAESSQRGYLLLGDPHYLAPYQEAARNLPKTLQGLDDAFASAEATMRSEVAQLKQLSSARFAEMDEALRLYRERGRAPAVQMLRTDVGAATMTQITERVSRIQAEESSNVLQASHSWQISRWVNFAITSAALLTSLSLVLLLSRLVLGHVRSKEREAQDLAERQTELEGLVKRRTEELSELSTHLQSVAEQEKSALSRELHDELGGLLVAARMDVSWLENRLATKDPETQAHFKRIHEALQAGVDVKRRVVENLRPTLLDNLGLLPALRWQVAEACGRAGLKYIERYPPTELQLTPEASIAIFRIVQEALTNILKHARAQTAEISLELQGSWLVLRMRDDGVGLPLERLQTLRSHGLAAMRQRATGLGGRLQVTHPAPHGTEIEVRMPLERVLAQPAASA